MTFAGELSTKWSTKPSDFEVVQAAALLSPLEQQYTALVRVKKNGGFALCSANPAELGAHVRGALYLSIYLSICLSIYLSIFLSIFSVYLSVYLSVDLSIDQDLWWIINLSMALTPTLTSNPDPNPNPNPNQLANDHHNVTVSPNAVLNYCESPQAGAYLALHSEAPSEGLAAVAQRDGGASDVVELTVEYGPHFNLPGQISLCTLPWIDLDHSEKVAVAAFFAGHIDGAPACHFLPLMHVGLYYCCCSSPILLLA